MRSQISAPSGRQTVLRNTSCILRAFGPAREKTLPEGGARVPDIAFVRIPTFARGDIEAYGKVFYSIDLRRRNSEMELFSERRLFGFLTGSPQALFKAETGDGGVVFLRHDSG